MSGFLGLLAAIKTVGSAVVRITNRLLYRVPQETATDILTVNGITVMVGNGGRVQRSEDLITFTTIDTPAATAQANINRVWYANDLWWALGTTNLVINSPDGVTWTRVNVSGTSSKNYFSIAWNGSLYVLAEVSGIFTSPDGVTWTSRTLTNYTNFSNVIAVGGTFYMACSPSSNTSQLVIASSADGINWSYKVVGTGTSVQPISTRFLWNGSYFVLTFGTGTLFTSSDNVTWTQRSNPAATATSTIQDIKWLGDRWGASYGTFMTSLDGVTWTATSTTNSQGGSNWLRLTTSNGTTILKVTTGGTSLQLTTDYGRTFTSQYSGYPQPGHPAATQTLTFTRISSANNTYWLSTQSSLFSSTDSNLQSWTSKIIASSLLLGRGVVYNGTSYVGSGTTGELGYSNDGVTWTAVSSGITSPIYAAAGNGVFVIAAAATNFLKTSTDGITWTTKTVSGMTTGPSNITWSGSQFLGILSASSAVISNDNGSTFTRYSTTGMTLTANAVVWGNSQYVAIANSGNIFTSPDGITWTARTSGTTSHLLSIAYNGSKYVVTTALNSYVLVSSNGIDWQLVKIPNNRSVSNVAANGSTFVIVGGYTTMLYSTDGVNWYQNKQALRTTNLLYKTGAGPNNSAIVADGTAFYQTDDSGETWTNYSISATGTIGGQVIYANGTYATGAGSGVVYRSDDGIIWSTSTTGNTAFGVNGIAYNGNVWVATQGWGWNQTGSYRFAYYSYDLVTWYATSGSTTFSCGPVKWLNDRFVTWYYGSQPSYGIQYSMDGITWASAGGGANQNTYQYNDVAYSNGVWVAVGNTGFIKSTNDFSTWLTRTSGTTNSLNAIASNGTYFLAVGASGTALMSADGGNWSAVSLNGSSGVTLYNVWWDSVEGAFIALSTNGSTFKLYP